MRETEFKEGLGDLAHAAERDHEVQMARADLYKIAKYAIKLHDMLKSVSEAEGLEGWQQSKITKAADYIDSVFHSLDYDMKFGDGQMSEGVEMCPTECCGKPVTECKCGPECPHCDCYSKNKAMSEKVSYKESLSNALESKKKTLETEKQKGVDGKACWKGYKRMGTKKKGGKTVDNCVKM